MNRDDLTRMAREAGIDCLNGWLNDTPMQYYEAWPEQLERFAALVAEAAIKDAPDYKMGYADGVVAEREACAKEAEDWDSDSADPRDVAAAIRARGQE